MTMVGYTNHKLIRWRCSTHTYDRYLDRLQMITRLMVVIISIAVPYVSPVLCTGPPRTGVTIPAGNISSAPNLLSWCSSIQLVACVYAVYVQYQ